MVLVSQITESLRQHRSRFSDHPEPRTGFDVGAEGLRKCSSPLESASKTTYSVFELATDE